MRIPTNPAKPHQRPVAGVPGDRGDAAGRIAAPAMPDGELGKHQRHDHQGQSQQIEGHEGAAAIRSDLVRKFPDAANADRGTDGGQHETDTSRPLLARIAHSCSSASSRQLSDCRVSMRLTCINTHAPIGR